jgi:hypothetical protein
MPPRAFIITIALLAPLAASFAATGEGEDAPAPPQFLPAARSVSNWRAQAGGHLDLPPERAQALASGVEEKGVTRCVRLNNYWCVKGVGWNGMLAADAEGHAAFASAEEGATVAALLLRRYYMSYSRRSAQAIVSRWAPAECRITRVASRPSAMPLPPIRPGAKGPPGIAQARNKLGPAPKATPDALSMRGVNQTLRARWLARGNAKMAKAQPRSRVAERLPPLMRAPGIAVGLGEKPMAMPELKLASLAMPGPELDRREPPRPEPLRPIINCDSETNRLKAYAQKASAGVAASPDEDLALFTPEGEPTPNLARVMENMSAVEIGPLRADKAVIAAGIARAMAAIRQSQASKEEASR